ncbi:hypothetical protein [Streptomyces poriticola]|uniref:hypothetical protein n=1 Tax=Streptomyces poriticola TaxID=3120506 RepID=UPI002FCE25E9
MAAGTRDRLARLAARRQDRVRSQERDWSRISIAVSAVVAGIGLILTAISTGMGTLVAEDQLEQSRQAAEEDARRQAAQVVMWFRLGENGKAEAVISNHSRLPVLSLYTTHYINDIGEVETAFPDLPACSQVVLDGTDLPTESATGRPPSPLADLHWIIFTDSNGSAWKRNKWGSLERYPAADGGRSSVVSPRFVIEPVPKCGGAVKE